MSPGVKQKPRGSTRTKDSSMYKKLVLTLAVLSVVAVAPLLSACHTTAGAGEDISATGKAIESSAKRNTP
jgi:predicted small secreted protein